MPAEKTPWSSPTDLTDWKKPPDTGNIDAGDEALIPIENPTGLHRYVKRATEITDHERRYKHVHQQQWRVVDFTTSSNGVERLEWRDVPLVEEPAVLHGFEKPPLGQPPAFLQEQEMKIPAVGKKWCPGCSAYVDYACAQPHCAIGPNGLQARLDRVDASLAKQLQTSMEKNARVEQELFDSRKEVQQLRESLIECLDTMGWVNYTDTAMEHEALLGNEKAPIILRARAAIAGKIQPGLRMRLEASIKANEALNERVQAMRKALEWIVNSPGAHPANVVKVAEEGLGRGE